MPTGALIVIVVAAWVIVPMLVASHIGGEKGRAGWAWGLFLGWFGVLIAAVLPPSPEQQGKVAARQSALYRECPHCKEQMRRDATVCPHCRMQTEAWTLKDGFWWRADAEGQILRLDENTDTWALWIPTPEPVVTPAPPSETSSTPGSDAKPPRSLLKARPKTALAIAAIAVAGAITGVVLLARGWINKPYRATLTSTAARLSYDIGFGNCDRSNILDVTREKYLAYLATRLGTTSQKPDDIARASTKKYANPTGVLPAATAARDAYYHGCLDALQK